MANRARLAVLKEKFEVLKDGGYPGDEDNSVLYTLATKIIVPTLSLDTTEGCRMWEYLLSHYYSCKAPVFYHTLTDAVVEYSEYDALVQAFSADETICDYVFRLDPYENHLHGERFIRELILHGEFTLAEKLIELYLQNNTGENNVQNNLFDLLSGIINSSESRWQITSDGIDFVFRWIPLVKSKTKRAQLEVGLVDLVECVENDAPKGAMPFSLFTSEGGFQLLMEEKQKQIGKGSAQKGGSFDQYMAQRDVKRETVAELKTAQSEFSGLFDFDALQKCQDELNSLIGLKSVKDEVTSLTNLVQIRRIRIERGLVAPETSQHLVFMGNPGTGKTTVARIIGKIYHALGVLSKGHFVEVDRSGLVAGYVGQTALKTKEVIDRALGGVLFIDEAYSLYVENSGNDFGREAIDTILKAMEDNRNDLVVIVAGYDALMPGFINSNPGLKSRFNKYIHFPDYDGDELMAIFLSLLKKNQYSISLEAKCVVTDYMASLYANRDDNFGNGRDVRNFFEKLVSAQANRLVKDIAISERELTEITLEDVNSVISQ